MIVLCFTLERRAATLLQTSDVHYNMLIYVYEYERKYAINQVLLIMKHLSSWLLWRQINMWWWLTPFPSLQTSSPMLLPCSRVYDKFHLGHLSDCRRCGVSFAFLGDVISTNYHIQQSPVRFVTAHYSATGKWVPRSIWFKIRPKVITA